MGVRVTTDRFDPGAELTVFLAQTAGAGAGAAATFTGMVRSSPDEPVSELVLECYVELAINQLEAMVAQSTERFGLLRADVIHRYGRLLPGEPIVQVMTQASHRAEAFAGAEFLMDYLKTDAPFWKQEKTGTGTRWIEARAEDEVARLRWD